METGECGGICVLVNGVWGTRDGAPLKRGGFVGMTSSTWPVFDGLAEGGMAGFGSVDVELCAGGLDMLVNVDWRTHDGAALKRGHVGMTLST